MRNKSVYSIILMSVFLCIIIPSLAHAIATNLKRWNTNEPIVSDTITLDCSPLNRPVELGRLLDEPDPVVTSGEFDDSVRAGHPIKVALLPQGAPTLTTDNLTTINGCTQDGEVVWLATQTAGHVVTVKHSATLVLPGAADVVLSSPTQILVLTRRLGGWVYLFSIGGSGGGSGGSFSGIINDAICGTKNFQAGTDTSFMSICSDTSAGPILTCWHNGDFCDNITDIAAGKNWELRGNGTLFERMTSTGTKTYHNAGRPTRIVEWSALSMIGDGTQCNRDPSLEIVNGVPDYGIRCPMSGTEIDGFIHGSFVLPGSFDKTGDMQFWIKADLITDASAGTWHGQIAISCVAQGGQRGTWSTAVNLDLTPDDADIVGDLIHDIASLAVDTDTTGANCNPGNTLYWRWTACDTDATPSGGCASSVGYENDMSVVNVRATYRVNSNQD